MFEVFISFPSDLRNKNFLRISSSCVYQTRHPSHVSCIYHAVYVQSTNYKGPHYGFFVEKVQKNKTYKYHATCLKHVQTIWVYLFNISLVVAVREKNTGSVNHTNLFSLSHTGNAGRL
jgi:hypothetical protein